MRKHLIILVDGTWMSAQDGQLSNIFRLNQILNNKNGRGEAQIVFYVRGLGTGFQRSTDGLTGMGVQSVVEEIYIDLCSNYVRNDTITLVGFSRGGMVARSVAGLIAKVGLLKPERIDLLDAVICEYLSLGDGLAHRKRRKILAGALLDNVKVNFLGAFDCVSTVLRDGGEADRSRLISFADKQVARNVQRAVQILALDEARDNFEPELWTGATARNQVIEQIWMPGIHSNVGGCNDAKWLGDVALLKMIERMRVHAKFLSFSGPLLNNLRKSVAKSRPEKPSFNGGLAGRALNIFGVPRNYDPAFPSQYLHRMFSGGKVPLPERKTMFVDYDVRAAFLDLPPK